MVWCTPFALYVTHIHIGFEQACSTQRQTSTWFCRSLVWRDSTFNALSPWSMREARYQQMIVVWLRPICGTERRRNCLWRKKLYLCKPWDFLKRWNNAKVYCLLAVTVFPEDLMPAILIHVWKYVCLVTRCKRSQCETERMPFMLCRILGKSLLWQCADFLQQESALSKVPRVWWIGISPYHLVNFPYESCCAILGFGTPSFPPLDLIIMQW